MSRFVKGQWYQCKATKRYFQCVCSDTGCVRMRQAGDLEYYDKDDISFDMLIPASLTPDFSNANVGDECFSPIHGIGYFTMMKHKYGETTVVYDNGVRDYAVCAKGTTTHPLRYNSFAQFKAYWAEQALEMGGKDE